MYTLQYNFLLYLYVLAYVVYKDMHAPCLVVTLPASLHTACLLACRCKELVSMHVLMLLVYAAIASSISVILASIELLVLAILLLGYAFIVLITMHKLKYQN